MSFQQSGTECLHGKIVPLLSRSPAYTGISRFAGTRQKTSRETFSTYKRNVIYLRDVHEHGEIPLNVLSHLPNKGPYDLRRQPQRRHPSKQRNCFMQNKENESQLINEQRPRSVNNVNVDIFTCLHSKLQVSNTVVSQPWHF